MAAQKLFWLLQKFAIKNANFFNCQTKKNDSTKDPEGNPKPHNAAETNPKPYNAAETNPKPYNAAETNPKP